MGSSEMSGLQTNDTSSKQKELKIIYKMQFPFEEMMSLYSNFLSQKPKPRVSLFDIPMIGLSPVFLHCQAIHVCREICIVLKSIAP